MLLAYVYIEKCMNEKTLVRIIDHHGTFQGDKNLLWIIEGIIKKNNLPIDINHSLNVIKYKL